MHVRLLHALSLIVPVLLAGQVQAEPGHSAARAEITVAYVQPSDPAHQPIYEALTERRVLERVRDHLNRVALPSPLSLKVSGCNGQVDAWYDAAEQAVTICYEYIAYIGEIRRNLPPQAVAFGLTPKDAIVGPFLEVVAHEVARVVVPEAALDGSAGVRGEHAFEYPPPNLHAAEIDRERVHDQVPSNRALVPHRVGDRPGQEVHLIVPRQASS